MTNYKLGSLFDGSGGFPLAGALCGIEPIWASEVEPYPIAVTHSRFPTMKHLGDISKVNGADIEPVDIITFGSPCQDLSVAGKQAGLKHTGNGDEETTRSGLFMEAVRIIKEMRQATNGKYPTFALWENVPGAFSSNRGGDFRVVLEELIKIVEPGAVVPEVPQNGWPHADNYLGDGWSLAYRVLDAQYWGVPQRRRRIYLVLDLGGERARNILFEREGLRGYFTQSGTPLQGTSADAQGGTPTDDVERGGRGLDAIAYSVENHPADSRVNIDESGKVQTLTSRMGTGGGNVPMVMEPFCKSSRARSSDDATTWKHATIANTLNTFDQGEARANELVVESAPPICVADHPTPKVDTKGCAFTLNARDYKNPQAAIYSTTPLHYIVRRLTPTECARLQGFPDKWGHLEQKSHLAEEEIRFWTEVRNTHAAINGRAVKDYTEKQMLTWYNKLWTDSAEYKMWGNGIALPTALYCMQGMADALEEQHKETVIS